MYGIQVNVARSGLEPLWRFLIDDQGPCKWETKAEVRAAMVEEDRGKSARVVHFHGTYVGAPLDD